jgi:hypothetical protein
MIGHPGGPGGSGRLRRRVRLECSRHTKKPMRIPAVASIQLERSMLTAVAMSARQRTPPSEGSQLVGQSCICGSKVTEGAPDR